MPQVELLGQGFVDVTQLDVRQVPIGTYIRATSGDYYRLAESTLSPDAVPAAKNLAGCSVPLLASATTTFVIKKAPDVPRNVTVTVSASGWDGGNVVITGIDSNGVLNTETITPLTTGPGTVSGSVLWASFISPPSKTATGSSVVTAVLGYGDQVAFVPQVVAARDQASMRWLYASSEKLLTAMPLLALWDTRTSMNTDAPLIGAATSLQDVITSFNYLLRALVTDARDSGVKTSHVINQFMTNSER